MYLPRYRWLSLLLPSIAPETQVKASPVPTAINTSISNGNPAVCVMSREWSTPSLVPQDCIDAAMRFNRAEVVQYQWQDFEFSAYGATHRTHLPAQTTPRRFTYSKPPEGHLGAGEEGRIDGETNMHNR